MSILITGGAGYIGSVLAWELEKHNEEIIILDDLSCSSALPENLPGNFYKGSLLEPDCLKEIFTNHDIEVVCHLGAIANVPDSVANPLKYYDINTYGTLSLIKAMKDFNVKNMIFSSTAAVYGDKKQDPYIELDITNPINPYGKSKLFAENIISDHSNSDNFSYISFRYFCVAGASKTAGENRENETHLIPRVIDHFLGHIDQIEIYGNDFATQDGTAIRDYIHVLDIARAHILGIEKLRKERTKMLLNLGSNTGFTVLQVIRAAEDFFGKDAIVVNSSRRAGDPEILLAENSMANDKLIWEPRYSIKDMIESAVSWRSD